MLCCIVNNIGLEVVSMTPGFGEDACQGSLCVMGYKLMVDTKENEVVVNERA
jgi:hypothetical protein